MLLVVNMHIHFIKGLLFKPKPRLPQPPALSGVTDDFSLLNLANPIGYPEGPSDNA